MDHRPARPDRSGHRPLGACSFSGLLLGCAFATSVKTVLLLSRFRARAIITGFMRPSRKAIAASMGGLVLVPAALAAGSWPPRVAVSGVFRFRVQPRSRRNASARVDAAPSPIRSRSPQSSSWSDETVMAILEHSFSAHSRGYTARLSSRLAIHLAARLLGNPAAARHVGIAAIDRSRARVPALAVVIALTTASLIYSATSFETGHASHDSDGSGAETLPFPASQ